MASFTLKASPGTDIWRKPPTTNVFSAPHTLSTSKSFPLASFRSARITLRAHWKYRYDQAGLLFLISDRSDDSGVLETAKTDYAKASWIKAGLEYYNGAQHISFVGCDRFADWSVHPAHLARDGTVTVELRREGDENGVALLAYEVEFLEGGVEKKWPIRECTWLWDGEKGKLGRIGAMAARPADVEGGESLEVVIEGLVIDVAGDDVRE